MVTLPSRIEIGDSRCACTCTCICIWLRHLFASAMLVALAAYNKEVADALLSLRKTREQFVVQGNQVGALRTYARLARLRFEGGYTSYIDVLDAKCCLFNAQQSYAQTQGVVFTLAVNLCKAMGGGRVADARRMTSTMYGEGGDATKSSTSLAKSREPQP